MVSSSKPALDETKYLETTLEKGFETFQLSDLPFSMPSNSNHEGQQEDGNAPPGGYRLFKSRFTGLVALVSILILLLNKLTPSCR